MPHSPPVHILADCTIILSLISSHWSFFLLGLALGALAGILFERYWS